MDFPILILIGLMCCMGRLSDGIEVLGLAGEEVLLRPIVDQFITSITWKNHQNKVAEWDKTFPAVVDYYTLCSKSRCELNSTTGELKITRLTLNEKMNFSAEINGETAKFYFVVIVLEPVPKPTIGKHCNDSQCDLVCEAKDTNYTTYFWKENGKRMENGKNHTVYKSHNLDRTYTCVVNNNVSTKESEPIREQALFKGDSNAGTIAGVGILFVAAVAVLVGVIYCKKRACFRSKPNGGTPANGDTEEVQRMNSNEGGSAQGKKTDNHS